MAKKTKKPLIKAERESEITAEAGSEEVTSGREMNGQSIDEEQLVAEGVEKGADANMVPPAELAAVRTDNESAREASGEDSKPNSSKTTKGATSPRSKRYLAARDKVKADKLYSLESAIDLVKATSYAKFDGSVELHVRHSFKKGKGSTESIRGIVQLPHGTGKKVNAIILTEDIINEIAKKGSTSYDIVIATPALMPQVAKIAKILGPQGKMPTPKAGTVTADPEAALTALESGRIEYRADANGIVHQLIGKVSWDSKKLVENAQAVLVALPRTKIISIAVSATMGPGIRVDVNEI